MEERKRTLPEKCYERSMNHNYMILSTYEFFGQAEEEEDYVSRMILENKIPGLLPVICRRNAGQKQYCYEINSLQPLDRLYEKQEMGYEALRRLLLGMTRIFERMEEYLLDGTQIILEPEYLYLSMESGEPFLVCFPEYHGDIRESFRALMDDLLARIDHTQEQAVWLSYQVYRYTRNQNYVMSRLKELVFESEEQGSVRKKQEDNASADESGIAKRNIETGSTETGNAEIRNREIRTEKDISEDNRQKAETKHWNIIGGIICILISVFAGAVIFSAKFLLMFSLSQKQEIGLYGIVGMTLASSVLFFVNEVRRRKVFESLPEEPQEEIIYWRPETEVLNRPTRKELEIKTETVRERKTTPQNSAGLTTCLAGETAVLSEEQETNKYLKGVVNGEEMCIALEHFPLTFGKAREFSDITIPDRTVSRMHARLEERNGRVYLLDLNSTNGTKRNGKMIAMNEEVALEPGDKIMFGGVGFTYC